jgi:hypothetical protein
MRLLLPLALAGWICAHASADECEDLLASPLYHKAITFSLDERAVLSLAPESGSIEYAHPGVIRRLLEVRRELNTMRRSVSQTSEGLVQLIGIFTGKIFSLSTQLGDSRFSAMLVDFASANATKLQMRFRSGTQAEFDRSFARLNATLWELTVACLFGGDEIYLNRRITELPGLGVSLLPGGRLSSSGLEFPDSEIDLAVLREGRWRWIEIKDWNLRTLNNRDSESRLSRQGLTQRAIRETLSHSVELVWF